VAFFYAQKRQVVLNIAGIGKVYEESDSYLLIFLLFGSLRAAYGLLHVLII